MINYANEIVSTYIEILERKTKILETIIIIGTLIIIGGRKK